MLLIFIYKLKYMVICHMEIDAMDRIIINNVIMIWLMIIGSIAIPCQPKSNMDGCIHALIKSIDSHDRWYSKKKQVSLGIPLSNI